MVNLEWYRSFVSIYQNGTITAAAKQRFMTQPGISQHLAGLEKALHTKLFERTPRRMVPTESGKELYSRVIGAIERLDTISNLAQLNAQPERQVLRVGAPQEFWQEMGLRQLATVESLPYRIWTQFGLTGELINALEASDLDVVVATQKLTRPGLHYAPLKTETFVIIAPLGIDLPLNLSTGKAEAWYRQQAWISYGPELPIIRRFWQEVFATRPELTPVLIVPNLLMIIKAVVLGIGLSVVPLYLCQHALDERRIQSPWLAAHQTDNQLYLVCQQNRLKEAGIKWLMNLLQIDEK